MIVDHLIKFRDSTKSLPVITYDPDDETSSESSNSPAFDQATIHVMIVCSDPSHVRRIYKIYERLCQDVGIAVARPRIRKLKRFRSMIDDFKGSQATIAIVTMELLIEIWRAFIDHEDDIEDALPDSEMVDSCELTRFRLLEDTNIRKLFANTKIAVIEDDLEKTDEQWNESLSTFTSKMAEILSPLSARIVVSERDFTV